MSKSIKVSDEVYRELLLIQRPRETFSEIIGRLLKVSDLFAKAEPILRGQHDFLEEQRRRADAEKAAHG